MLRSKKLTRKDKKDLSKKGICWKCGGQLEKKQIICTICAGSQK